MSRQRFVMLLIAALVLIGGALYVNGRRNPPREAQGVALLPPLVGGMSSITGVVIRKGGAAAVVTLKKSAAAWTVGERGDYPADTAKLRTLLTALRDARVVEEKTSDPARYPAIGVEEVAEPGATGAEITVLAPGGSQSVILGKPAGSGTFVRRAGEKRSYSVEPAIAVETAPQYWIDSRLIDVSAALIQSVAVTPAAGPGYALHRVGSEEVFSLDGVPAGRKPIDGHALAPAPTTLTHLDAEDVAPAADIDFGQASRAIVTLSDGNVITLTGAVAAAKHWLQVTSAKDAAFSAKTQGRAFEVASYRYDAIFKPLEQLLLPKDTKEPKDAKEPKRPLVTAPRHPPAPVHAPNP